MNEIPEILFNINTQEKLGFEIVKFEDLFKKHPIGHKHDLPHKLKFYAIFFIAEGKGCHFIDFEEHNYKKGSLIFISKEQIHAFSPKKNYKGYIILFTYDFLIKNLSSSEMMTFNSIYNYQLYQPVIQIKEQDYDEYLRLINELFLEYRRKNDNLKEDLLRNYLKVFLLKSERYKIKSERIINSKYYNEFIQFQELLRTNIKKERQVNFYANELLMSTKKLNMITKGILGVSVKKVISETLMLEIKRSLMNLAKNTKEIAYEFGFDEPTNFIKYFKKYIGLTPSEFRTSNQ